MEIKINATPQEIAALVLELQGRQDERDLANATKGYTNNLVVEHDNITQVISEIVAGLNRSVG